MNIKLLSLTFVALITNLTVTAQDGEPDETFGTNGKMMTYFGSSEEEGAGFYSNYVVGNTVINGSRDFAISALQFGGLDNMLGRKTLDFGGEDYATALAVTPSGRYVAGYTTNAGTTSIAIAKYLSSNLDTGFGTSGKMIMSIGGTDDRIYTAAALTNGKVLFAGYTTTGTNKDFFLCLFNGNQLDSSFGTNGKVITDMGGQDVIKSIAITTEGKILVIGSSLSTGGSDFAIARYNSNGTLDTSFNATGKVITAVGSGNDYANAVVMEANKYIVLGSSHNGNNLDLAMVRYTNSGQKDTSYGNNGVVLASFGSGDDEATGGVIFGNTMVITGYTHNGTNKDVFVAKYGVSMNALEGQLIPTFGTNGKTVYDMGPGDDTPFGIVRIAADGYYRVGGTTFNGHTNDILFAQFTDQGQPDDQFGHNGVGRVDFGNATSSYAHAMLKQPDNKVIVAGRTNVSGNEDFAMVRYKTDGSLDVNFGAAGKVVTPVSTGSDAIFAMDIQVDNKFIVAGASNDSWVFARYNNNGTLDSSFGTGGIAPSLSDWYFISAIEILTNGKILVLGQKQTGNVRTGRLIRLNSNGTLDTSFGTSGVVLIPGLINPRGTSKKIIVLANDKIIVGGASSGSFIVARYNPNGSIDTTFASGTGYASTALSGSLVSMNCLALQVDGNILAAGTSGNLGGTYTVIRYTADGSLDTTFSGDGKYFNIYFTASPSSANVILQPDGKIIVGGYSPGGSTNIFRINSDGSHDGTFNEISDQFSFNGNDSAEIVGLALVNNKLVVGGFSYNPNGVSQCYGIARYNLGLPLSSDDFLTGTNIAHIIVYPNPVKSEISLSFNFNDVQPTHIDLFDVTGKKIITFSDELKLNDQNILRLTLPEDLANGTYILLVNSSKGAASIKIVK